LEPGPQIVRPFTEGGEFVEGEKTGQRIDREGIPRKFGAPSRFRKDQITPGGGTDAGEAIPDEPDFRTKKERRSDKTGVLHTRQIGGIGLKGTHRYHLVKKEDYEEETENEIQCLF
jgi:hypothetical protein